MKPLASLTSADLKPAAKKALLQLGRQSLRRTRGGWCATGYRVTLDVAGQLQAKGLARAEIANGRHLLVITGAGRMFAGVLEERRARK